MGHIIWLASYPKSGNTWLRIFLRNLTDPRTPADINALGMHFPYDVAASWYQKLDPRSPRAYSRRDVLEMRPKVQEEIAASDPRVTFVKTHSALIVEDGYEAINKEVTVGAIYVVRNPLDIAVSLSCHSGREIDDVIDGMNLSRATSECTDSAVSEHVGSWSENVTSWTRQERQSIHVARYEDMVQRPLRTFSEIAQFLGLTPSRAVLERAIKLSSFRVLREQERSRGFVERPPAATAPFFRSGASGDGARLLSSFQIERLSAVHRQQMKRFGYL